MHIFVRNSNRENIIIHEENYIELDNVTIGDCLDGYNYKNRRIVVNDGHIIGFVDEELEVKKC